MGLFAGVGGFELGLAKAGHEARLLCEIDPGARAVLAARFPGARLHADVRTLRKLPSDAQILTAGFPCQDLSQAGRTAGIDGKSSGLWREVFRVLSAGKKSLLPFVLIENVPFMLRVDRGRALDLIVASLEDLGYRWAYRVVDSMSFGLPQRRQRVFLLASLDEDPRAILLSDDVGQPTPREPSPELAFGFYWTEGNRGLGTTVDAVPTLKAGSTVGIPSPPAVLLPCGRVMTPGRVVTPSIEDAERLQGFPARWTAPSEAVSARAQRWRLVGNSVTVDFNPTLAV